MDLKSIQSLGAMTNRVIEIQQQINAIHHVASLALEEDENLLFVNIYFSTKADVSHEIDEYMREIFMPSPKVSPSSYTIENITKKVATIKLEGKYQMMAFEGLISVLKKELSDVSAVIKLKTGNL